MLAQPDKPGRGHHLAQARCRARLPRPHRPQVEAEIGVADRRGTGRGRHRLGEQQGAARGQRRVSRCQQCRDNGVVMVMDNANQADQIMPAGQRIDGEAAGDGRQARIGDAGDDRRQVEHGRRQPRRAVEGRGGEHPLPPADVEQPAVAADVIGREHRRRDPRLRCGHQRRVGGDALRIGGGVGPVAGQAAASPSQQRHGIGEVGVEETVVRDHLGDAGVAEQRRARAAERPALADRLGEVERGGGLDQSLGTVARQPGVRGDGIERVRAATQERQQRRFDSGGGDLRIDEAGDGIEQRPGPRARHGPRQREARRPALEGGVGEPRIAPPDPAFAPRRHARPCAQRTRGGQAHRLGRDRRRPYNRIMAPPVIVIGAGVGGLTAAVLLAARGVPVTVCEAAATPGGKLREIAAGGRAVDAGPTVFTMRWVFDEVFAAAGERLDDHLTLTPATTLARHAWRGGARLDLFADLDRSAQAVGEFAGAREAAAFRGFMAAAARTYATLKDSFLSQPATSPAGLTRRIALGRTGDLLSIHPFATLWRTLARTFGDPRLRQLFGRYATYSGSSPFLAPATLMLIAHVEAEGVWAVAGGMHGIARALALLAERHGATLRYAAPVAKIVVGRGGADGVVLATGERLPARAVIANADPQALAAGLFGDAARRAVPPLAPDARSLSALTWTGVAETTGFALDHHNVFFSDDYAAEFADLAAGRPPRCPSVYVCAADRAGGAAAEGRERLHLIVNAPAVGDALDSDAVARGEDAAFAMLKDCGLTFGTPDLVRTTPADFARMFPATGGALYGRASHGWRASFQRPGAATRLPGLFLAGGATHPGAGVPMAALSGRLAAAAVLAARR